MLHRCNHIFVDDKNVKQKFSKPCQETQGCGLLVIRFLNMNVLHEASARAFQYVRLNQKMLNATGAKNLSNSDLGLFIRLVCYLPDFEALNGVVKLTSYSVKHDFGGYRKEAFLEALNRMVDAGILEYSMNAENVDKCFRSRRGGMHFGMDPAAPGADHTVTTSVPFDGQVTVTSAPLADQPEAHSSDSNALQTLSKEEINSISNKKEITRANPTEIWMRVMPILSAFPRKDGKGKAMEYFGRSIKTDDDIKDLSAAIGNYEKHLKAHKVPYKFTKTLKTFAQEWRDWINPDPALLTPYFPGIQSKVRQTPQEKAAHNLDQKNRIGEIFGTDGDAT